MMFLWLCVHFLGALHPVDLLYNFGTLMMALAGPAQAPHRGRVLLAEDNTVNQKLARRMLEKLGCQVDIAANGQQVLQMTALATEPLRMPIIALTANAVQGDRERCLWAGMDDYVSEPVKLQTLAAVLERWAPAMRAMA